MEGEIPYTTCFVRCGESVLMLLRNRPPNAGLWNGVGGKISPGETPLECGNRALDRRDAGHRLSPFRRSNA